MRALVTGITGQTGSYMAEKLLDEGMEVYGFHRRNSQHVMNNLGACIKNKNFTLIEGDLTDFASVSGVIENLKPDMIFNYAAQSHVHSSFSQPIFTFNVNTIGVLNLLESIKKFSPHTRMLQASSSEQFGNNYIIKDGKKIQDESVQFKPRSPYSVSKAAAHELCYTYRESYGLYIVCSICFNHESPRRGEKFVTRKITKWIGDNHKELKNGTCDKKLALGNLESRRDWGHAKDYCDAMRLMMDMDAPDDFVICTNKTYSIKEFLEKAFNAAGIPNWSQYVYVDPDLYRPAEVDYLCGDNSKITSTLGWEPKYNIDMLVDTMVKSDIVPNAEIYDAAVEWEHTMRLMAN